MRSLWMLCLLAVGGFSAEPMRRPPNIVLILIDDMGWADGGCFGSKFYQTRNINRLASESMRFTQAYAACAVCSPTRAAIMTGKYPARLHLTDWIPGEGTPKQSRFRVPQWEKQLPLEEITIAESLKVFGFTSAAMGKWHLGGPNFYPEHQGFDINIAGGDIGHPASYFWPYGKPKESHRVPMLAEEGGGPGEYLTDRLTTEALNFIESHRSGPFFLYLAHYAVHAPLMGKESLIEQASEHAGANGQSNTVYAAMIQSVDESVGRVLDKLEELHIAENTIVVFTSDNGGAVHFGKPPATSNSPLRLGKGYAYEGGLRVPLLVKAPRVTTPGSVCSYPVISMDLFPTLLELIGGPPSASQSAVDGISLVPLLRGRKSVPRHELFWHYPHYWNGQGALPVTPYSITRIDDWKLIRFYESNREELYDLRHDPSESHDLAATNVNKRHQLATRLDAWLHEVNAQMPVSR